MESSHTEISLQFSHSASKTFFSRLNPSNKTVDSLRWSKAYFWVCKKSLRLYFFSVSIWKQQRAVIRRLIEVFSPFVCENKNLYRRMFTLQRFNNLTENWKLWFFSKKKSYLRARFTQIEKLHKIIGCVLKSEKKFSIKVEAKKKGNFCVYTLWLLNKQKLTVWNTFFFDRRISIILEFYRHIKASEWKEQVEGKRLKTIKKEIKLSCDKKK